MLPKWHILFGFLFAYIIYWFTSITIFEASLIFLSSVLIDFDHYLFYIFEKKDFNFFKCLDFFKKIKEKWKKLSLKQKKDYKISILIFHGIEFWILLILLSFIYKSLLWIFLGIIFHMVLDFIEIFYYKFPFYIKFSQIYVYISNKNKRESIVFS